MEPATMYEPDHVDEEPGPGDRRGDPSLAIAVTLAEFEMLKADAAIAQLELTQPDEQVVRDLSPLGQRHL